MELRLLCNFAENKVIKWRLITKLAFCAVLIEHYWELQGSKVTPLKRGVFLFYVVRRDYFLVVSDHLFTSFDNRGNALGNNRAINALSIGGRVPLLSLVANHS